MPAPPYWAPFSSLNRIWTPTRVTHTRTPLISSGQFPLTGDAHASPLPDSLHPLPGRFGVLSSVLPVACPLWVPSHLTLLDKWPERKENGAKTKGVICLKSVPQWITWGDSPWFASNVWCHTLSNSSKQPCFLTHIWKPRKKEKIPELIFPHRELFFFLKNCNSRKFEIRGLFCLQTFHLKRSIWILVFNLCYPKIIYKSCEIVSA